MLDFKVFIIIIICFYVLVYVGGEYKWNKAGEMLGTMPHK